MPVNETDDAFSHTCPYMMLWDAVHLGATAGAATYATVYEGFTGEAGTTFAMDAFGDYESATYTAEEDGGGTVVIAGVPYVFYKGNISEWVDRL